MQSNSIVVLIALLYYEDSFSYVKNFIIFVGSKIANSEK